MLKPSRWKLADLFHVFPSEDFAHPLFPDSGVFSPQGGAFFNRHYELLHRHCVPGISGISKKLGER
jgi:hypothetical protein